ncbi:hypothetical protein [Thiorhodococcus drewsii]|uniref:hypothetical protein n=1 Tax=Thiorhodococcus drewsii TaxID=210408 RepID=UPI001112BA31|nr:hypothetical protein [Thiorhodococcus drewsii]
MINVEETDELCFLVQVSEESSRSLLREIPMKNVNIRRQALGASNLGLPLEVIVTALAASPVLVQLIKSIEALAKRNNVKKIEVKNNGSTFMEGFSKDEIIEIIEKLEKQRIVGNRDADDTE